MFVQPLWVANSRLKLQGVEGSSIPAGTYSGVVDVIMKIFREEVPSSTGQRVEASDASIQRAALRLKFYVSSFGVCGWGAGCEETALGCQRCATSLQGWKKLTLAPSRIPGW